MKKEKKTAWYYMARVMALSTFLGLVWAGFQIPIAYGEWRNQMKNEKIDNEKRMFTTQSDKTKHYDHINSDFTPVKSYQKQLRLDSIYDFALEQLQAGEKRDSINRIKDVQKDSSRNQRTKDIEDMKKTQSDIKAILQDIYTEQTREKNDSIN